MIAVYVAAASAEIERAERYMQLLRNAGVEVTSTWACQIKEHEGGVANDPTVTKSERWRRAATNLEDILKADILWMLCPSNRIYSHGAFWELGFVHGLQHRARHAQRIRRSTQVGAGMVLVSPICIVASGGDQRWPSLALSDRMFDTDAEAFDRIVSFSCGGDL